MKKYLMLIVLAAFAGITINCGNPPVPQGAYRVKTRGKIHLFGLPLPISVPNPGISLNLKTTTAAGTAGTTGTISEFTPGGGNIQTDLSGIYDARDAVLPAVWSAKVAPSQSRCTSPVSNPFSFSAVNGGTYKVNCKWNVLVNFLVQPGSISIGPGPHPQQYVPSNSLTGILVKDYNGSPTYKRMSVSDLKAEFYRKISGEDYVLESEEYVISISPDGSEIVVPVPDYSGHQGIKNYRILIKDTQGDQELYVGHGEINISYGFRRNCPGSGQTCQ